MQGYDFARVQPDTMGKRKQAEGEQGEPKRVKVELVQPERDEMPGALAAYFPCGLPQGVDSYEVFENASKSAAARTKHFTVLGRMVRVRRASMQCAWRAMQSMLVAHHSPQSPYSHVSTGEGAVCWDN